MIEGGGVTAFRPGPRWVDVPPDAVLPADCEIRMDMTTGQRRARWPDASSNVREFLEHFRPAGSTTYVGIVPDGTTVAATFNGEDPGEAQRWITSQNRTRGIYFTCNPTPADLRKKPTKGDITAIAAVWADIDPLDGNGRDWTAERGRLLALAEALAAFPLAPSLIIDSGNGIQPIWLLTNPIEANPEYRNTAEALCARLEAVLGAKGTHNVDRLLRVPGTRNFPNAKKRALGRGETQARLVHAKWRRYSWRDLEDLVARLEAEPLKHAERVEPRDSTKSASIAKLDLPSEPPEPLDFERLKELRARHPSQFDLAGYNGDRSRQDLALASLARRTRLGPRRRLAPDHRGPRRQEGMPARLHRANACRKPMPSRRAPISTPDAEGDAAVRSLT